MRKYIFITVLAILPLQAFCDRFWVCSAETVQRDIKIIEDAEGLIKDINTTKINDHAVSYTIQYESGADIRDEHNAKMIALQIVSDAIEQKKVLR